MIDLLFIPVSQELPQTILLDFSFAAHHRTPTPATAMSLNLAQVMFPEEPLNLSVHEGAGFYPARLGETLKDGQYQVSSQCLIIHRFTNLYFYRSSES